MKRYDIVGSACILAFSVSILSISAQYELGKLNRVGPGFMPLCLSIVLSILSLAQILRSIFGRHEKEVRQTDSFWKISRVVVVFVCMIFYGLSLKTLGFLITTCLFIFVLFKFVESYNWTASILSALAASFATYFIFSFWLRLQFPSSLLGI